MNLSNAARGIFLRAFFSLWAAALFLASCTTRPVLPEDEVDPTVFLPEGEDFYLLTRPAEHRELIRDFVRIFVEADPSSLDSALGRTEEAVFSGKFSDPDAIPVENTDNPIFVLEDQSLPPLSGQVRGDFPAFFLRSSLRGEEGWEKAGRYRFKGPGDLLVDTAFKDTLLIGTDTSRLEILSGKISGETRAESFSSGQLPSGSAEWWGGGIPALMVYIPVLNSLPLPDSLPAVPEGASMEAVLTETVSPDFSLRLYNLEMALEFPDSRSARLWSLGVRLFLAARLGLSDVEEEQASLRNISLKTEENVLYLNGWVMSSDTWGRFIGSFR